MLAMFMLLLTGCSDEQASHSTTSSTDTKQAVQVEGSSDQENDHSPSKANREDVVGEAATVERVVDGDTLKVEMLNGKSDRVRIQSLLFKWDYPIFTTAFCLFSKFYFYFYLNGYIHMVDIVYYYG